MNQMTLSPLDFGGRSVSPFHELGAYEALWCEDKASFKTIAEKFKRQVDALPSDFVDAKRARATAMEVAARLAAAGVERFGVRVHGAGEYPDRLRDAEYPIEVVYYQGWWELVNSPRSIAVVGTRNPSEEGVRRARKLVRALVEDGFTIVSGLAKGIDVVAHETAIEAGGHTIAVIGTPLSHSYPSAHAGLQRKIACDHLLISQVPVLRYDMQPNPVKNRHFFPERNITMSALTDATVIIEAGETSGTLVQAKAALKQNRKLFILESNFQNPKLTWPHKFEELGAIRVREYGDITDKLISSAAAEN